jgi:hypothetical protein
MKTLALITAMLLVTGAAAHAVEKLPNSEPIIGTWCYVKGDNPYFFIRKTEDNDNCTFITIVREGYDTHSVECGFTRVRRLRGGRYVTHVNCDRIAGPATSFQQDVEFQIVDKMLRTQSRNHQER